jgi:hypothetical protein
MRLELNDPAWMAIFLNIVKEYPDDWVSARDLERRLSQIGITVGKDLDGRWEHIRIPDDENERILFMLRWA